MELAPFQYHAPRSLDDAIGLLDRHGDEGRVLAGGQSLVPQMGARLAQPRHVIDINGIAKLDRTSQSVGRLRIPPLVRHRDLETPPVDGPLAGLLALVARASGPAPIRARGTVCGSLSAAFSASAWCVAGLALNADVAVRSRSRGARTIPLASFFRGGLTTAMEDDEMLVELQLPILAGHARWGFSEIGRRGFAWPQAVAIAVYERDEDEMQNVRIAVGGIEGAAVRVREAEKVLERAQPGRRVFREAAEAAAAAVRPVHDPRDDADWRRDLARASVVRALDETMS